MKKLIFLFLLLLTSCSASNPKEESTLQETARIANDYVDTLTGSVHDARDVAKELNARQAKVQQQIDNAGR